MSQDAFQVLMSKNKPKRKSKRRPSSTGSRFVLCPVGCGLHVAENSINLHLDSCIQRREKEESQANNDIKRQKKIRTSAESNASCQVSPEGNTKSVSDDTQHQGSQIDAEEKKVFPVLPHPNVEPPNVSQKKDVFRHMMMKSKEVFSQENPLQHCFHLDEHGELSLTLQSNRSENSRVSWSSLVNLKNRANPKEGTESTPRQPIELMVSSSIPSHMTSTSTRLVKRHSRLSVPVLKSILQKSIRRRKPLPAVRTAMELADKSLGDLLRRLPIIILEDSFLHPDFCLLVWLMIAVSKEFVIPPRLLTRVMQIVFEIASCPWNDPLVPEKNDITDIAEEPSLSLLPQSDKPGLVAIYSMLCRAAYGGMKGDVEMLLRYASLWQKRFDSGGPVPDFIASRLVKENDAATLTWLSVPAQIHERAKEQSIIRVSISGIDQLLMDDICIEGIDFHCSAILEHLLSNKQRAGICQDLLLLSEEGKEAPSTPEDRRSWLERILKSCMWNAVSGVNRRRPLVVAGAASSEDQDFSELWKLFEKDVHDYQKMYVKQRLARPI